MTIRYTLFVSMLLAGIHSMAQSPSHNEFIKRVTKRIAYVGVLKCEQVSRAPYTPAQYIRFDSLRKQCSSAELQALLKHRAPVVRAYAFQALAERPEVDLFSLLLLHQQDTAKYALQCGCMGSSNTVVDGMLSDYQGSSQYARDKLDPEKMKNIELLQEKDLSRSERERQKWKHATNRQRFRLRRQFGRLTPHESENF